MYIRHNNAPENKVFIKITNDLDWKLGITMEYTGKNMPQQKQLMELGFGDTADKAQAMILQANVPEKIKYKLCKECFTLCNVVQ